MAGTDYIGYCSLQDVKDWLFDVAFVDTDANTVFTDQRLLRAITRSYAEINAALLSGNYAAPVSNTIKTQTIAGEVAGNAPVEIAVTAGDGDNFSPGDTVRIHGVSTTPFKDEFASVAAVSGDTLTVFALANSYDSGATVELCSQGFLHLRECNAMGAAAKVLFGKVVGQSKSRNEKIIDVLTEYKGCLADLQGHKIKLDGLADTSVIETYQSRNPNASDVDDPVVTMGMDF